MFDLVESLVGRARLEGTEKSMSFHFLWFHKAHIYSPRIKQTFICEISGSRNIAAEDSCLLGCDTLSWGEQSLMF